MGTYNEIEIDGVVWQSKAFGKSMTTLRPGDRVEVVRATSNEDPEDVAYYTYDELPDRYIVDIGSEQFALVEKGILVGLASEDDEDELLTDTFDYYGRDEHDDITYDSQVFEPVRPRRAMTAVLRSEPLVRHLRAVPDVDDVPDGQSPREAQ